MAYTDDSVKAKLSALNETQESIVTVAQWVMFHRRHAERTAQIWLQKVRDSPAPKRLNLLYLANEVAQQSKARNREEFLIAFSPIIAEATATAYKGASDDIQGRMRRVVEVWRQRNVFEGPIQEAIEARVNGSFCLVYLDQLLMNQLLTKSNTEIDKNRSTTKKQPLGGSFFKDHSTGSTPSELQPLVPLQVAVAKAAISSKTTTTTSNTEYDKLQDPKDQPAPPVHAARLSSLLKTLANAETSVSEVIKSRQALIAGLEKLLETNRAELAKEESLAAQLADRKIQTEGKRREVEDAIVRGFNDSSETLIGSGDGASDMPRPAVEALTPPPVEALTPVGSPKPEPAESSHGPFTEEPSQPIPESLVISQPDNGMSLPDSSSFSPGGENDFDFGSNGAAKRRKVTHDEEDYAKFAKEDLDADVAELIAQQGQQ
ncbi:hypothetical protein N7532_008902 [Penicillium argentinense]|uniref:CID domain-containing protein n=1 Tax=Penicillium argentinense TaxID=1131581 RepID=A0A9W9EYA2_9EURO|nr:uncharacterized protein N7532_008902 [Penicillium argentinense]KAJ5090218.1 hypothetical protein N7532_008902 [Penicillium argentinense]